MRVAAVPRRPRRRHRRRPPPARAPRPRGRGPRQAGTAPGARRGRHGIRRRRDAGRRQRCSGRRERPGGRRLAHPAAGRGGPRAARRRGLHDRAGARELARHPPLLPALRRARPSPPRRAGCGGASGRAASTTRAPTPPSSCRSSTPTTGCCSAAGRTGPRGGSRCSPASSSRGSRSRPRSPARSPRRSASPSTTARYLGNQPWPFPSSVMIGFAATTRETELTIDPVEMAEARWVTREEYRDLLRERHDPHPERHLDRQADHRALARRRRSSPCCPPGVAAERL